MSYQPGRVIADATDTCRMCGTSVTKKKVATKPTPAGTWVFICSKCDKA